MAPIFSSIYPPLSQDEITFLSQFLLNYKPDSVLDHKVIHIDTIKNKSITYRELRKHAALCAFGSRSKVELNVSGIILCLVPNSTDLLLLAHSVWLLFIPNYLDCHLAIAGCCSRTVLRFEPISRCSNAASGIDLG